MSLSTFRIAPTTQDASPPSPPSWSPSTDPLVPAFKVSDQSHAIGASTPPQLSVNIRGSYDYDCAHEYSLKWSNKAELDAWLRKEAESKTIEFVRKHIRCNKDPNMPKLWIERHIYVCGRGNTGGKKNYQKKHSWTRKVPVKHTAGPGCPCRLTVAFYPGTDTILGKYNDEHSHEIGSQNARFTRLPKEMRKEIERLLRLGVDPKKVVRPYLIPCLINGFDQRSMKLEQIQGRIYTEENLSNLRAGQTHRREFVTRADVHRIEKIIEEETIRLASQDGASVLEWVKNLQERGHFVALKTSADAPPANSGLETDGFVMIIQTKYQRECWQKNAHRYAGIDATHNTTHYANMSLFTLLVQDRWGHGESWLAHLPSPPHLIPDNYCQGCQQHG